MQLKKKRARKKTTYRYLRKCHFTFIRLPSANSRPAMPKNQRKKSDVSRNKQLKKKNKEEITYFPKVPLFSVLIQVKRSLKIRRKKSEVSSKHAIKKNDQRRKLHTFKGATSHLYVCPVLIHVQQSLKTQRKKS